MFFPRNSWSFQVVAGWHISFHPEISALPWFNQTAKIPDSSYLLHLCKLSKNHIPIDYDLNILRYWFCIHGFPGHLGAFIFYNDHHLGNVSSEASTVVGAMSPYWVRSWVGQASIAHVRSQLMGNLGEKRWPNKSPHFPWDDSTRRSTFFPGKKNNQAFWRKWWLDTLVEHKTITLLVDSFFGRERGKSQSGSVVGASHNFSHLPWYLIILPRCWLWLRYVYCPPNHAAGVLRISPTTKQVELIGIGRSVVTNGVSCLFHWDENMKDIYIKWLVLSDEHNCKGWSFSQRTTPWRANEELVWGTSQLKTLEKNT